MLSKLLRKELCLSMHPTMPIMLVLSAMVLIPNYPYTVIFFYSTLSIFFTCLLGRENNDIVYSLALPIAKKDVVRGRMAFSVLAQLLQITLVLAFSLLKHTIEPNLANAAGIEANLVLAAAGFFLYGLFNLIFYISYYRSVSKVGVSFVKSSVAFFGVIAVLEVLLNVVPFLRDVLDTPDPLHMGAKLVVLAAAVLFFAGTTLLAYRRSVALFSSQDVG